MGYKEEKVALLDNWEKLHGFVPSEKVRSAFLRVPREEFVLKSDVKHAYDDYPLPIIHGQTISQPYMVVIMTEALNLGEGQNVLEIGAGSGYQAALIAEIVGLEGKVISVEYYSDVAEFARNNLKRYANVRVIFSDKGIGYEEEAPYDRIIVTAACHYIPEALLEQLKPNGVLLAPVGSINSQTLIRVTKCGDGKFGQPEDLGPCIFVPLMGEYGFHDGWN